LRANVGGGFPYFQSFLLAGSEDVLEEEFNLRTHLFSSAGSWRDLDETMPFQHLPEVAAVPLREASNLLLHSAR